MVIPSEINGLPVTYIHEFAFMNCATLTGVVIPATVEDIYWEPFSGCPNLTSIYFLGNAPAYTASFGINNLTVYYASGTTGWGETFGGFPTEIWLQDSDTNDLPDWWEIKHFSTLGVNQNSTCSNGINTIRQAYIAGLDPVSETSVLNIELADPKVCNGIIW